MQRRQIAKKVSWDALQYPREGTYVVGGRNGNTIFIRMPAHVQDLLVEVDLVRIGLLLHAAAGAGRAARARAVLLSVGVLVHRRRHAHLLRLEGRLVRLEHDLRVLALVRGVDHKVVVVAAGHDILGIAREDHLEFVEDAVVLVRVAQARSQVFVDGDGLDGLSLHVDIPDLDRQVIPRHDVSAVVGESDVGDGGDDFGKEGAGGGIFFLLEDCLKLESGRRGISGERTLVVLVTQRPLSHVGKLDGALGTGIHEPIAAGGVEFGGRDDFRQLLHVRRLDVDDVEALVLNIQVPQVHPQVVATDEGFPVAVDGDAVDVIGVRIGVRLPRDGGHDGIMMRHAREFQQGRVLERLTGRSGSPSAADAGGRQLAGEVVLGDDLQRLVEHLPQLYRFIISRKEEMRCI